MQINDNNTPGVWVDSNAYEGNYNFLSNYIYNVLPQTTPRQAPVSPGPPAVDISQYTNGGNRGTLFICDLIRNGGTASFNPGVPPGSTWFDQSPGDFRLSPSVSPQPTTAPGGIAGALNPLVDRGYSGPFPIQMRNGMSLSSPPGTLQFSLPNPWSPSASSPYAFTNWRFDCEGFGNPRIYDHPSYSGPEHPGLIDIGADEVGELIVAGYRWGTTHFLEGGMNNRFLWYLAPGQAPIIAPGRQLPVFGAGTTAGAPWADCWDAIIPAGYNWPYYRPSAADTIPYLLPDAHPWWSLVPQPPPVPQGPANPLWDFLAYPTAHNWLLYLHPTDNMVNPAGTYGGFVGFTQWLDHLVWGPSATPRMSDFGGPLALTNVDDWCVVYSTQGAKFATLPQSPTVNCAAPPSTPVSGRLSSRYTLEFELYNLHQPNLLGSNVQTFMTRILIP